MRDSTTNDLREQFNLFRVIVDIHIPRVKGESHGFGFVRYRSEKDVVYLSKMNPNIKAGEKKVFFGRAFNQGRS